MAFYVFYIWILAVVNFRTRLHAIKSGQVHIKYFRAFIGEPPPEKIVVIGRHYDNQFQLPMLFFVAGILHFALGHSDCLTLAFAWLFVVSRCVHSYIHLSGNNVRYRAIAFGTGWFMVMMLWVQLVYFVARDGRVPV